MFSQRRTQLYGKEFAIASFTLQQNETFAPPAFPGPACQLGVSFRDNGLKKEARSGSPYVVFLVVVGGFQAKNSSVILRNMEERHARILTYVSLPSSML
jgi:hypothetical protein